MTHQPLSSPLSLALPMAFALAGCVTTGDLEQLESRVTEQLQAMEARHQPKVDAVRTGLAEMRGEQESLRNEVAQGFSNVRADAEAFAEAMKQGEASRARMQEALQAEIAENRKALSQYAGESANALRQIAEQTERATAEVTRVRQGMVRRLVESYRAEEAALREQLKAVVRSREDLESLAGPTDGRKKKSGAQADEANASE